MFWCATAAATTMVFANTASASVTLGFMDTAVTRFSIALGDAMQSKGMVFAKTAIVTVSQVPVVQNAKKRYLAKLIAAVMAHVPMGSATVTLVTWVPHVQRLFPAQASAEATECAHMGSAIATLGMVDQTVRLC